MVTLLQFLYMYGKLLQNIADYTGYTHRWGICDKEYSKYCMASVENVDDYYRANDKGFRTFRVILDQNEAKDPNEKPCPAQLSDKVHCDKCAFCDGSGNDGSNMFRKNVTVVFHGACGRKEQYAKKIETV